MNTKSSRKQIVEEAFKFHSEGNISMALKYYQHFINKGFRDHRVFLIMEQFYKVSELEKQKIIIAKQLNLILVTQQRILTLEMF